MKISARIGGLVGVAIAALTLVGAQSANAQMYTTGPGLYMSLEGRYLHNNGDKINLTDPSPSTATTTEDASNKFRADKDWGGKATMDYRFPSNWDVGISTSGMKSQH